MSKKKYLYILSSLYVPYYGYFRIFLRRFSVAEMNICSDIIRID